MSRRHSLRETVERHLTTEPGRLRDSVYRLCSRFTYGFCGGRGSPFTVKPFTLHISYLNSEFVSRYGNRVMSRNRPFVTLLKKKRKKVRESFVYRTVNKSVKTTVMVSVVP